MPTKKSTKSKTPTATRSRVAHAKPVIATESGWAKRNLLIMAGVAVLAVAVAASAYIYTTKHKTVTKTPVTLTKVKVKLKWLHNAQFAGLYYAKEKGYFAAEGLDVSFEEWSSTRSSATKIVDAKEADFGVSTGTDIINARANSGRKVVGLATVFQHDPEGYVALKSSGITDLKSVAGHNVGLFPGKTTTIWNAMLKAQNLSSLSFKQTNMDFSKLPKPETKVLTDKTVDVYATFLTDQAVRLKADLAASGSSDEIVTFNPYDYGIANYNDTLFTYDDMVKNNPALVQKFVNAAVKGWHDAIADPTGAVTAIHAYDGADYKPYEAAIFKAEVPFIQTNDVPLLWTDGAVWKGMYSMINATGSLKTQIDVTAAYDSKFVRNYYNIK